MTKQSRNILIYNNFLDCHVAGAPRNDSEKLQIAAGHFSGFSLLEVLVSIFILTFGLLGIMGIYLNSFKRMEDSYWYTLVTSQLIAAVEQQQTFDNDYFNWRKDCERLLPHGECRYENNRISVCWINKQRDKQCLSL